MAKENQTRFRIVKKTNKEVTIKIGPETHTIPWEEYDKTFVTVDKFWAVFNEENQKRHEQVEEAVSQAVVHFLAMRAAEGDDSKTQAYLVNALGFGEKMEEIQKLLNCSMLEATQIIQRHLMVMNPFMTNPMFPVSNSQKKLRRKIEREADSEMNLKPAPVFEEPKPTLGDAFSCLGDLKSKLEAENK